MIDWISQTRESLGPWGFAMVLLSATVVAAVVVQTSVYLLIRRAARKERVLAETAFLRRSQRATLLLAVVIGVWAAVPSMPLGAMEAQFVHQILRAVLIAAIAWTVIAAVAVIDDLIMARHDVTVRDNLRARRIHTRARVLTRTVILVIAIAGGAGVLMSFPALRQVGTGLLASAGIVGVAAGFAAKPTLGNLIAGLQIAITEPIRLDDAVIIDGEWGWVEEITATYVVIKIWDQRRLIVPLSKFIEEPFQNWTRTRADILGSVTLFVDFTCPIAALRDELKRYVATNDRWDGRVVVLQVVECTDRAVQLRALVSAGDSPTAWDLRCEVREHLIGWLQREHPESLPRLREVRLRPDRSDVLATGPASPHTARPLQTSPPPTNPHGSDAAPPPGIGTRRNPGP